MLEKETTSDAASRRRGRPAGKNRIPLSQAERRARNAQYERQRRNETADAMAQLAKAIGCDISMSNSELLASVVARLQNARAVKRKAMEDIERLRLHNANLMQEIAELERHLCSREEEEDSQDIFQNYNKIRAKIFKHKPLDSDEDLEGPD